MYQIEMYQIENWWKHNGCFDREQASGILYILPMGEYLAKTDDWWDSLTDGQKKEVYEDFFSEV